MVAVVDALERYLGTLPANLAESPLAASALAMAREIDNAGNSATSKSMCQARLQDALKEIRTLAPEVLEADPLDELEHRRATRIARGSAA